MRSKSNLFRNTHCFKAVLKIKYIIENVVKVLRLMLH